MALDADIATIAQKGAGKTYTNRGMVERLLTSRRRVVIMDPLNSWWGLKAMADGRPGFPVAVIGGPNADVPLDPHAGEKLGAFVAASDISMVIDVSELRRGEMIRFATDFLAALYRLNRDPIWLVLEEADVFAPQQPMGDATVLLHHVDQIARRGRARGFRLWTITQRPAKLAKDILTQTSTLIMLRLRSPQDRAAAEAWIVGNAEPAKAREIVSSLASLPVGEGWVWSPDHDLLQRVKFPPIRTLDTSATPVAGEARRTAGKMAEVDLGALREALKPEPVAEKAGNSDLVAKAPSASEIVAAEQRGFDRGLAQGERRGVAQGMSIMLARAQTALHDLSVDAVPAKAISAPSSEAAKIITPAAAVGASREPASEKRSVTATGGVTGSQQKILNALAWWAALGIDAPTNEQLGFVAGYAPGSGNFNNLRSGLRSADLIVYAAPGTVTLTSAGVARAQVPQIELTRAAFHSQVRTKLSGSQLKLLDPILGAFPACISTDELATAAGYAAGSGNFNNLRSSLRSINLIDYPAAGRVRAAGWLFPGELK